MNKYEKEINEALKGGFQKVSIDQMGFKRRQLPSVQLVAKGFTAQEYLIIKNGLDSLIALILKDRAV